MNFKLFVIFTILHFGHTANITIDVDADITNPSWVNQCASGYHQLETFSCDQGPLIPPGDYTGSEGYWARCSVFFVPRCDLFYQPPVGTVWKQVIIEAYFQGGAAVEVAVQHTGGFFTRFLQGGRGWNTVSLDISLLPTIIEIKVAPEFQGTTSFTAIDKIIFDDEAPPPTTTTTTTPPPSTTEGQVETTPEEDITTEPSPTVSN